MSHFVLLLNKELKNPKAQRPCHSGEGRKVKLSAVCRSKGAIINKYIEITTFTVTALIATESLKHTKPKT